MHGALTDAELVSRALAGSDAAFSRLVERHQAAVRAFLRRFLLPIAFATPPPSWRFLSPYLSTVPIKRSTGFFDDPFVAYNLEAATHEGSLQVSRALGDDTRLSLPPPQFKLA